MAAVLPLISPEKGAQLGYVGHGILLVCSGVYYPTEVLPGWMQAISKISPATSRARGGARRNPRRERRLTSMWHVIWPLLLIGAVCIPLGPLGLQPRRALREAARQAEALGMSLRDERVLTVQAGYDALGPRFGESADRVEGDPWEQFLDDLAGRLDEGGRILDLGCGAGRVARRLAGRFDVVGVDVSEQQLLLARAGAPAATFLHGDFARLDFPARSFDAVTALYSFVHVPRREHQPLLARIARWLKPGGLFLASLTHVGGPDRTEQWLGVDMFFSGYDAETNTLFVRRAGLELLAHELVFVSEPEAEVGFLWVLARA